MISPYFFTSYVFFAHLKESESFCDIYNILHFKRMDGLTKLANQKKLSMLYKVSLKLVTFCKQCFRTIQTNRIDV